jgi:large subunit ribosomal protein L17
MRHRHGQRKLGRPTGHRLALIRNLMTDLIRHERLQTTEPRAAELRREVEKLIGAARFHHGSVHAHRLVAAKLYDEAVVKKLFAEILPRFEGRPGGFTRTTRLAPRRGDGAPMAQIELVQ